MRTAFAQRNETVDSMKELMTTESYGRVFLQLQSFPAASVYNRTSNRRATDDASRARTASFLSAKAVPNSSP